MNTATMNYEIRRYESAAWNDDAETWELVQFAEVVRKIEASSPSDARNQAEETVDATRTETTQRRIRGRSETLTQYMPCSEALMAWKVANGVMALVLVVG